MHSLECCHYFYFRDHNDKSEKNQLEEAKFRFTVYSVVGQVQQMVAELSLKTEEDFEKEEERKELADRVWSSTWSHCNFYLNFKESLYFESSIKMRNVFNMTLITW